MSPTDSDPDGSILSKASIGLHSDHIDGEL
jgi:hypothetical protein